MRFSVTELGIKGVRLIAPRRFEDARGAFIETYRRSDFADIGIKTPFLQDNLVSSKLAGTIRGLHFQRPPHAQAKLIRVSRGMIYDVAIDLRVGSPTYGRAAGVRLAPNGDQLFIPAGCAHGYCTLEPGTEVAYKCDAYYAGEAEGGVHFADPGIAVAWPVDPASAVVSDKDRMWPMLRDLVSPFVMEPA